MTVRTSTRTLTGKPATSIDVYLGVAPGDVPQATIWANKYRAQPIPLRDPAVVRELIKDLGDVLAHLEGRLEERRLFEPRNPEELGEWCGLCKECCPDVLDDVPERPCGRVHDCDLCERKRG